MSSSISSYATKPWEEPWHKAIKMFELVHVTIVN